MQNSHEVLFVWAFITSLDIVVELRIENRLSIKNLLNLYKFTEYPTPLVNQACLLTDTAARKYMILKVVVSNVTSQHQGPGFESD